MKHKLEKSIANLKAAFAKLEEYLSTPIQDDRDRAGIIKAFEFTFELVWKNFQKLAQDEGLEVGGPRSALKAAFQMNLIHNSEEVLWLRILEDRNLMSHTYQQDLSRAIVERIQSQYRTAFSDVIKRLQQRLS